jgi:hypothetical protein
MIYKICNIRILMKCFLHLVWVMSNVFVLRFSDNINVEYPFLPWLMHVLKKLGFGLCMTYQSIDHS